MSPAVTRTMLVVVAATGVFFAGMFARGLVASDDSATPPTVTSPSERPHADPGPDQDPDTSEHTEHGLTRDEATAVDTALDLVTRSQDWLYLSDSELEAAVREVSAPGSVAALVDEILPEVRVAREALANSPGRVWWIVRPLAWRVESFSPRRAQVSVWTVSILSAADVAMPQSDWTTTLVDLEWDGDRWLLRDSRDMPGPTPQLGGIDGAWEPEPFDDALDGFQRIGSDPAP